MFLEHQSSPPKLGGETRKARRGGSGPKSSVVPHFPVRLAMKILTAEQIREIDRLSTAQYGIPSLLLMENAGMRVVEAIQYRFENIEDLTIAVLCGKGNNGGDGFVVARQLVQKGCSPFVFLFADESEVRGDARTNLD